MNSVVLEFFLLSRAERQARAYTAYQHGRIRARYEAADRRLQSGRRLVLALPAAVLLRDAVVHYLAAAEIARRGGAGEDELSPQNLASTLPSLPRDPLRPAADPSDEARVRAALASSDPLHLDRLSLEETERTRWALDRAASMLRRRVEARSLTNIRGTRWGRLAALTLLLGYVAADRVQAHFLPINVALHKPVSQSSVAAVPADGQDIVDGDTGSSFGVHTQLEDSPHVVIDLLGTYFVDRIKVHNRVDGWFDDCLPLVVELSVDGRAYREVARRDTHFGGNSPWVITLHGGAARYVRLRVARRSYLALSEVEVFGRPQ